MNDKANLRLFLECCPFSLIYYFVWQRSFLSRIRLSRELHGPKVKVTVPPIKKNGSSELSAFYHLIFGFLASYRVSKYKKPREITYEIIN
jgi:hypothetical protein